MPKIHYAALNQTIEYPNNNTSILEISIENRIPHLHECGGHGQCTTCRIRVLDGQQHCSPPNPLEIEIASARNWDPGVRLACQCYPQGDVTIQRLLWSGAEVSQLQLELAPSDTGEEREIAILCCDLRKFTEITSRNLIFDMAHMINRFYTMLGDPILMNNGIIYQYVGDEIIGLFGTAGGSPEQSCMDALRAASGMRFALNRLNHFEIKEFGTRFDIGIGLHYGRAYLGHLGHPKHRQFVVLGDVINTTSRIQNETKHTGTDILMSEDFLMGVDAELLKLGDTHKTTLRGQEEPMQLHPFLGFQKPDMSLEVQSSLEYLLKDQDKFASAFYDRLFQLAPETKVLFKRDMQVQGRLLTHMLGGIVYTLSRPHHLTLGLRRLGKNHAKYGVKPEHYPKVKQALLETIRSEMGEEYRESMGKSWSKALDLVISVMQKAAS